MNRTIAVGVAIVAWIAGFGVAWAETGMGLMVDIKANKLRRVDLEDGKVIATSAAIGSNMVMGRFSPDGSKMVTIDKLKNVAIRNLHGTVIKTFQANEANTTDWGNTVSWTNSGLWVGGTGNAALYDATTGAHKETVTLKAGGSGAYASTAAEAAATRVRTVSHNDKTAGGRPKWAGSVLLAERDSNNRAAVIKLGGGCSVGPSPDGGRITRNLWEAGVEHQTMTIHDRTGPQLQKFYLYDTLPYPRKNDPNDPNTVTEQHPTYGFTWNTQSWSSNSSDIILIPAGRCFKQMDADNPDCSTMPWIYNLSTAEAFCLYDANNDGNADCLTKGVWWYIKDFYRGKISSDFDCGGPGDCNDGNACTNDVCSGGQCTNPPIADCCTSASQCDDDEICTNDICSANKCSNSPIANCCTSPDNCRDGVACTEDTCVSNQCQNPPIFGCCNNNGDCDDGNPCTTNSCNTGTGECFAQTDPDCCQDPSECDDGDICTEQACVNNTCSNPPIDNCCKTVDECDDQQACTTDSCEGDRCQNVLTFECCEGPQDCGDGDECTEDLCNASNQCENRSIDGCELQPSIDLQSPQGGEVWAPGSTAHIKWNANKIAEVVLYLSKDGGETWDSIGSVYETDSDWGDFQYAVPQDVRSDTCVVMVEDYFQQGSAKSQVFAISADPPSKKQTSRVGLLVGGCETASDQDARIQFPWPIVLLLAPLVWAARRRRTSRCRAE